MDFLARIAIDPEIRCGQPCVRGTRMTVGDVLSYLASEASEATCLSVLPEPHGAPTPGIVRDLAARYLDSVHAVYGPTTDGEVCAVLNIRTRAVPMGLSETTWQQYAVGDDVKVNDSETGAPHDATPIGARWSRRQRWSAIRGSSACCSAARS